MIRIQNLAKRFAARGATPAKPSLASLLGRRPVATVQAVDGLSLLAPNGSITGLLGPNGAGKTTTLRMLAGMVTPDAGQIDVDGVDALAQPRQALARMGILADAHGLYPRLTARENIVYFGRLQGMDAEAASARADALAELLDMKPLLERRAEGFSQGERMKTSLARALVHDPANVVLDEPTNGLDVLATRGLREVLRHLKSPAGGGKCIVFSTHIMQEVEMLCDHVLIVARGRVQAQGSVAELLHSSGQTRFEDAFVHHAFGAASQEAA
ncbi:ATP-binding cassette domain-containing protein [Roseateles sp. BYS180W]|uniref:ATP-binding cassette domain-containing protein n=1 Tax=Roseateles rivi TaxID=3299028 RepID=A0ABW7FTZ8_9BURK